MSCSFEKFLAYKKRNGKVVDVRIISGSMEPWIQTNSHVDVKICEYCDVNPLDIVVFWRQDKLICHILVIKNSDQFVTAPLNRAKGKELELDPVQKSSTMLGKVVSPKFNFLHRLALRWIFRKVLEK